MLNIQLIPARSDNYIYALICPETRHAAIIDPGEHGPVEKVLNAQNLQLKEIWLTHHHDDHIHAAASLHKQTGANITGFVSDAHRLPTLHRAVMDGESFVFAGHEVRVRHIPGHTLGHIFYHIPQANSAFVGDTLFAMGCGRMFEGDAAMMYTSLRIIASLPTHTKLYVGHEYSLANARFAIAVEKNNPHIIERLQHMEHLRAKNLPTLPTTLQEELATNPFLRTQSAAIRRYVNLPDTASDIAVFAALRTLKDSWNSTV